MGTTHGFVKKMVAGAGTTMAHIGWLYDWMTGCHVLYMLYV